MILFAKTILFGKDINRAMQAVLIVEEALNWRFYVNFQKWLEIMRKYLT